MRFEDVLLNRSNTLQEWLVDNGGSMSSQQLQNILSALQRQQSQKKQSQHGFSEESSSKNKAHGVGVMYGSTVGSTSHDPSNLKNHLSGEKENSVANGLSTLMRHRAVNPNAQNRTVPLSATGGTATACGSVASSSSSSSSEHGSKAFDNSVSSFSMGSNVGYMSQVNDKMSGCVASQNTLHPNNSHQFNDSMTGCIPNVNTKTHDSRLGETTQPVSHLMELNTVNNGSSLGSGNPSGSLMWNNTGVSSSMAGGSPPMNRADTGVFYNSHPSYKENMKQGLSQSMTSDGNVNASSVESSVHSQFNNSFGSRYVAETPMHSQQSSKSLPLSHEQQQQQQQQQTQLAQQHLQQSSHQQFSQKHLAQQSHPHHHLHQPTHSNHSQQLLHQQMTQEHFTNQANRRMSQLHPPNQHTQHIHQPAHMLHTQQSPQQPQQQPPPPPPQQQQQQVPSAQLQLQQQSLPQHIQQQLHTPSVQQQQSLQQLIHQQPMPQQSMQQQSMQQQPIQQPHMLETQMSQPTAQHHLQPMQHPASSQPLPHLLHSPQMPQQPVIAILRLEESSIASGSWQFDINDIKRLVSCFGTADWVKLLELPTGCDRAPDCAIAQFSDSRCAASMVEKLDGFVVPGVGKLSVVVFPASIMEGLNLSNDGLESLILYKLQGLSRESNGSSGSVNQANYIETTPINSGAGKLPPSDLHHDKTLDYLIESFSEKGGGGGGGNEEGLAAYMSTMSRLDQSKNIPPTKPMVPTASSTSIVPPALRSHSSHLLPPCTSGAMPSNSDLSMLSKNVPFRKHVCRLELVDMFSFFDFDVPGFIIGKDGSNIKYVLNEAKNQVDIDLVGMPVNEASVADRLHLTVTSFDKTAYTIAVEALEDLLQSLCQQLAEFCLARGGTMSRSLGFRRHEYKEGPDGQMIYLGQTERPKQWLSRFPPEFLAR